MIIFFFLNNKPHVIDNQTLIESLSGILDSVFPSNDTMSLMNKTEIDSNDNIGLEAILGRLV